MELIKRSIKRKWQKSGVDVKKTKKKKKQRLCCKQRVCAKVLNAHGQGKRYSSNCKTQCVRSFLRKSRKYTAYTYFNPPLDSCMGVKVHRPLQIGYWISRIINMRVKKNYSLKTSVWIAIRFRWLLFNDIRIHNKRRKYTLMIFS